MKRADDNAVVEAISLTYVWRHVSNLGSSRLIEYFYTLLVLLRYHALMVWSASAWCGVWFPSPRTIVRDTVGVDALQDPAQDSEGRLL